MSYFNTEMHRIQFRLRLRLRAPCGIRSQERQDMKDGRENRGGKIGRKGRRR